MDIVRQSSTTSADTSFSHPRFTDVELVGEGSLGRVYRAHDLLRGHVVAVKTILNVGPDEVYWLKSEFRSLADVRHRNLAELHELVVDASSCFFTMELVDGVDFVDFVERALGSARSFSAGAPQTTLLYDCLAQLVYAIRAVHRAGKLHRDIKPSNILVTREGRVVLLDFGLTIPVRRRTSRAAAEWSICGTPAYMSPEQSEGRPLSPKTDWYSAGVVLYEALTGTLPFTGSFADMLSHKLHGPPDPRDRCPTIPAPLAALVVALLEPEAAERPDAESILESIGADAVREGSERDPGWFVGRASEMRELYRSLERSQRQPVVAHVRGESGIGKSALLQRWCDRIEGNERALVLRSRCHPRESLPFKALDGAIDGLTQQLRNLAAHDLSPEERAALIRLFPVLARVPAFAEHATGIPAGEPFEARRSGAEAFRRLLRQLSRQQPLVLWIDDLQWGDLDSAWMLRTILQPPDPPPLLVVLSYRPDCSRSPVLLELERGPLEARSTLRSDLELGPLSEPESEILARLFLEEHAAAAAPGTIARESAGSPFFIRELALHRRPGDPAPTAARLESVLTDRLSELDETSIRILDTVALATGTLEVDVALDAAGVGPAAYGAITRLQGKGFLRLSPLGDRQAVQPYHDRVREAALRRIAPDAAQACHRRLAEALARRPDPDPEALFIHHRGAEDLAAAARYAEMAADRAARMLAFDRAASLYASALDLAGSAAARPDLVVRLAEAFENGGRSADAAQRYLEAAESVQSAGTGDAAALDLRRRAAVCFMKSGHLGEGRRHLWTVLEAIGVKPPRNQSDAIRRTMLLRVPLVVRRIRAPSSPGEDHDARARERLAALWGATTSFVMTEQHTAAYIGVRFVRAALATGRAPDVARAILHEAACEGALRFSYFRRRSERLLAMMERVAEYLGDPYVSAYVLSVRASNEWQAGRWRRVVELCERSLEMLRASCHGVSWEIGVALNFSFNALSYLGRMRELGPRLDAELSAAQDRGDVLAMNHFRLGQSSFARLAAGDPDQALALAEEARSSMPTDCFDIPHYHHLMLVTQCHLYGDDPVRAWRLVDEEWPRLRAAQFLQIAFPRVELFHLRARCALALLGNGAALRRSRSRLPSPAA
ncbi:MAG: protein kinase, partial [Thermodesulfobacteriota bacterium]